MKRKRRKESKQGGTNAFEENHGRIRGGGGSSKGIYLHMTWMGNTVFFFYSIPTLGYTFFLI